MPAGNEREKFRRHQGAKDYEGESKRAKAKPHQGDKLVKMEQEEEEEGTGVVGPKATEPNRGNCLLKAISPVVGDIACQQNHVLVFL